MNKDCFFDKLNILSGSNIELTKDSVLIIDSKIKAFGDLAKKEAIEKNIPILDSGNKIIAPLLVDIHSTLREPITGFEDNLINLKVRAKKAGFGTIALLPDSKNWRDKPEKIPFQTNQDNDINILFWGSFTLQDEGLLLAPHQELLSSGAIGLSSSLSNDLSIIFKGIKLNEIKSYPLLFSLQKNSVNKYAFVNEDIQSLQCGFNSIENFNNTSDLKKILDIKNNFLDKKIIIKNIPDLQTCKEINNYKNEIFSTISWWSLVSDTSNLKLNDIGWKADPPLLGKGDRDLLIDYLEEDLIDAIAVNSNPLNDEETLKPINEREIGISSYELVLPLLWDELISKRGWNISKLWKHLSFLPSRLLGLQEEKLTIGSNRWLIFDPDLEWLHTQSNLGYDSPSNFPKKNEMIKGRITEYGLEV